MPTLRLFASAREAAGTARAEIEAETVAEILEKARHQFGERFGRVLDTSRVWVNGQPAEMGTAISGPDIVAVLPPVSGGSNPPVAAPASVAAEVAPRPPTPPTPPTSQPSAAPLPTAAAPDTAALGRSRPLGARAARPPRRLRLVPPPPPDDLPDSRYDPESIDPSLMVASMGRLALAPVASPDLLPDAPPLPAPATAAAPAPATAAAPAPATAPAPAPSPSALPLPAPAGQQAVAVALPEPVPVTEPKPTAPLAVVHQSTRPHGRLGVAWAVVTGGALIAGPGWLAMWLAVIAFVAASQTTMVWRKRGERPLPAFAGAAAAALPLAAVTGLDHMNMVVVGAVVLTLVARMATPTRAPSRDVALTLVIGLSIGMAAAAPVLLRTINIPSALYLLACAAMYDAGAYLVGTGASSDWEGPAAGIAALIPVTMVAAVVLVPPFHGGSPLLLGALAAVLAPFGPVADSALLGDRTAHAPALRRLDSLLVLGPIWAWCAAALLI